MFKAVTHFKFESSVNSDGTQTLHPLYGLQNLFESSVNSDGTQTAIPIMAGSKQFEISVNSDGTQTLEMFLIVSR